MKEEIFSMKVGILIACRMKSQRLPRKALLPIVGKPLIDHLIERMKTAKKVQEIILCTSTHPDDAILQEAAERNGIQFFRGSEEDVMGRFIAAAENFKLNYVVRVTGDNPLTDAEHIDKLIESHLQTKADFSKVEQLPLGTNCEVISLSTLKKAHEMALDPNLSEYMTAYLKQPKYFKINLLEVDHSLKHPEIRLTVDVKEDLQLMEEIYRRLYVSPGKIFSIREIVQLLVEKEPDLLEINKKVPERALPKILMKGDQLASKPKIVVLGGCREVYHGVVLDIIEQFSLYNIVGLVDDDPAVHNTTLQGIPVLGGLNEFVPKIPSGTEGFFVASKNENFRKQCFHLLKQHGFTLVNIIHPRALISEDAKIGEGIFVGKNAKIYAHAILGDGTFVAPTVVVEKGVRINDFTNVTP